MSFYQCESFERLHVSSEVLETWCHTWKVMELAFFGSVLREDFRADSDVDVLVCFSKEAHWNLFDLNKMADELELILGRQVDLLTRRGVEQSRNHFRRSEILGTAQVIYAA